MGRTSTYKEVYCNELIECLALGHSITGFCGQIGVGRRTVFDWMAAHPVFKASAEIGAAKAVLFWEQQLTKAASQEFKGNIAAIIFGLKNRAHEDWRDVQKHELTGKDGGTIKTEEVSARDEISRRISGIAARNGTSADPSKLN